ncbi:MAG: hypothetical protein HY842_17955 [Bacteroidetes bacterium]|nr:hypothetical protein [Bacteroidota bacterium]
MKYLCVLLLVFLHTQIFAQLQINGKWIPGDSSHTQVLTTVRGDEFVGRLLQFDSTTVAFKLETSDTLHFGIGEVKKVEVLPPPMQKPKLKYRNIKERLLISPTGFSLEAGENEYRNIMFLYNAYHHGLTDKITIGGGIVPFFIFNLGWIDAKVSFELDESIHVGVGGIFGGGFAYNFPEEEGDDNWIRFGYAAGFGALTIGSKENFINLSTARITVPIDDGNGPWLFSIGGAFKIGGKTRLFMESGNYVGNFGEWTMSIGISTLYNGNNFDAALLFFPDEKPRMLPAFAFAKRF